MTVLRDITGQYLELLEAAKTEDIPQQAIADTLEGIEGEFEDKAVRVVHVIQEIGGDVLAIEKEEERLRNRKKVILNKEKSIRDYLRDNMEASGISKIDCPLFSITLAKGRDIVVIDSEGDLPDEFITVKTSMSPDKKALLAALKQGGVEGAHLEKSKPSLRIK